MSQVYGNSSSSLLNNIPPDAAFDYSRPYSNDAAAESMLSITQVNNNRDIAALLMTHSSPDVAETLVNLHRYREDRVEFVYEPVYYEGVPGTDLFPSERHFHSAIEHLKTAHDRRLVVRRIIKRHWRPEMINRGAQHINLSNWHCMHYDTMPYAVLSEWFVYVTVAGNAAKEELFVWSRAMQDVIAPPLQTQGKLKMSGTQRRRLEHKKVPNYAAFYANPKSVFCNSCGINIEGQSNISRCVCGLTYCDERCRFNDLRYGTHAYVGCPAASFPISNLNVPLFNTATVPQRETKRKRRKPGRWILKFAMIAGVLLQAPSAAH